HVFHGYFGARKTRMFLAIERALARVTSQLVAPSPRLVEELAGQYHIAAADKFAVVPLGFDLAQFVSADAHRGQLRRRLGLDDGAELVGIIGRMVPVKDHATFVAAAAELAARRPRAQFVFVGAGELEAEVRAAVRTAGLDGRAHFLGWTQQLAPVYADL